MTSNRHSVESSHCVRTCSCVKMWIIKRGSRAYKISLNEQVIIGRSKDCYIVIENNYVSLYIARLTGKENHMVVLAMGSITVNGCPIKVAIDKKVHHGDVIGLGYANDVIFTVYREDGGDETEMSIDDDEDIDVAGELSDFLYSFCSDVLPHLLTLCIPLGSAVT